MRRLTAFLDAGVAGELCEQCNNAGIQASITTESGDPWTGQVSYIVWVSEDVPPRAVDRVWASFRTEYAQRRGLRPTRVDTSAVDALRCRVCGYDLRGQVDDGRCPECGHPYYIIRPVRCSACGAEVPGDFEVCWKCGGDMAESRSSPASPE